MKKGFTFQQVALLLLALIILITLIVLFLTQQDQIASAMESVFGGANQAVQGLDEAISNL